MILEGWRFLMSEVLLQILLNPKAQPAKGGVAEGDGERAARVLPLFCFFVTLEPRVE